MWPTPRSTRALQGFLGLAGHYRKFIQEFSLIATILTKLFKKEGFHWSPEADATFAALKQPRRQPLFYSFQPLTNRSLLSARPLAYFSKPFATRHTKLAVYERKLIGLVLAVCHWRSYLLGYQFVVCTNHYSQKFMLDQRLSIVPQHRWVSKLFGFDFTMEYRLGKFNTVADALSRRDLDAASAHIAAISVPTFALFDDILSLIHI